MNKILITGAVGFIGSSLSDSLLTKGYSIVGIDNFSDLYNPEIKKENIRLAIKNKNFTLYQEDIRNKDEILNIIQKEKPKTVVHIAGITGMKDSVENPGKFYSNNVTGTFNMLDACRIAGIQQFVYASTSTIYGNSGLTVNEKSELPEAINPYSLTKKIGEDLGKYFAENYKINTTILRLSTVYGPRQRATMGISTFVRNIDHGELVEVFGDGTSFRNYLYIDDCVSAFVLAIEKINNFEIFNVGGVENITLKTVIKLCSEFLDKNVKIKNVSVHHAIPNGILLDNTKAKKVLGYLPKTGFDKGLKEYINYYINCLKK